MLYFTTSLPDVTFIPKSQGIIFKKCALLPAWQPGVLLNPIMPVSAHKFLDIFLQYLFDQSYSTLLYVFHYFSLKKTYLVRGNISYREMILTLPMPSLLSSKAQGCKDFWKPSKPCLVGTHWKALAEFSQISTHLPVFQAFFRIFENHLIPVILVFIRKPSRWVLSCEYTHVPGLRSFAGFLHHFVLAKLATSSIRVKNCTNKSPSIILWILALFLSHFHRLPLIRMTLWFINFSYICKACFQGKCYNP